MAQSNWQLKDHDDLERPYWEITNGPISLCVNDDDIEEEHITAMKEIVSALNSGGIQFHSENALELKQHIEIMELKEQAQRMADALKWIQMHVPIDPDVDDVISGALQQFKDGKGKEDKVYRPCPHCGKELFRDRNLCCRACGKEVGDEAP